jgi:plasmid maintenance system antidote protein VapI
MGIKTSKCSRTHVPFVSKMTQKEMSKKLYITQGMVSKIGKGEILTIELILKISEKFGKSTDWILKRKN